MHMADALLSPGVGGIMWAASCGLLGYSAKKLRTEGNDRKIPLMGVMGAFIFTAQMINFSIPGTGSSGHIGGGLLLAILLGPHAAFLTLASVLAVQALFFADGGLLALGSNIFNLGLFPCFIAYPLIFKPICGNTFSTKRLTAATLISAVIGLELGAFGVIIETVISGVSELPFTTFTAMMLPIHLAIGIVEGLITATIAGFICRARPDLISPSPIHTRPLTTLITSLAIITILTGTVGVWFASSQPDGLEWAMAQTTADAELEVPKDGLHATLAWLQTQVTIMPDYDFPATSESSERHESWPTVSGSPVAASIVGGLATLATVILISLFLRRASIISAGAKLDRQC